MIKIRVFIILVIVFNNLDARCQEIPLGKVKLKLDYMAYACGDCYAQYKVLKVLSPTAGTGLEWLKDKDIFVQFSDSTSAAVEKMKLTCETCFLYEIEGTLKKEDSKITLLAQSYRAYERYKHCCSKQTKRLEAGRKKSSD